MLYVKNLYKSYQTGKNKYQVLNGVDFCVEKGEFVAVMGPSGSGKTTLLNCISCYIPFDKGEITIGGTNLAGLDDAGLAHFRNTQLGFVFQDFMLLDGLTIRENILVPRIVQGEVSGEAEELADRLTALFGIQHIAAKYPAEISGGEKQRISIARAMLKDAPIIILDEVTASVDPENEAELQAAIEALTHNKTIVMIAHRLKTVRNADQILVLDGGHIVQQGTHEELLGQPGLYARFIGERKAAAGWKLA